MALTIKDFGKEFEIRPKLPGNNPQKVWTGTPAEKYFTENGKRMPSLFSGQHGDLTLDQFCELASSSGYKAVELACWGKCGIDVQKAAKDLKYCADILNTLAGHGLVLDSISAHLVGQAVSDQYIDERHKGLLPPHVWGDGKPEGVRRRAKKEMILTAQAARNLGVKVVNGFTGSRTWHLEAYDFPPASDKLLYKGYVAAGNDWNPILDAFGNNGKDEVKFALEVHPTEQAFNLHTADKLMRALGDHEQFGFNYDPSHFEHQNISVGEAAEYLGPRILHVHDKDAEVIHGRGFKNAGKYNGGVRFGHPDAGWDFRSLGKGNANLKAVTRALNGAGYIGPRSVEWEDSNMDRRQGIPDSREHQKSVDFAQSNIKFDDAMAKASKTAKKAK